MRILNNVEFNNSNCSIFKIKPDYMIDDAITAAKEKYAREMGFVNQMEYPPTGG